MAKKKAAKKAPAKRATPRHNPEQVGVNWDLRRKVLESQGLPPHAVEAQIEAEKSPRKK